MITPFASHILIRHDATQGTFAGARLLEPIERHQHIQFTERRIVGERLVNPPARPRYFKGDDAKRHAEENPVRQNPDKSCVPPHLVLDSYERFYDDDVRGTRSTTCHSPVPRVNPLRRRRQRFSKFPSLKKQSPMVWRITGTYNDQLAYDKFAVFALVSSFLPDAVKLFRETREVESNRKRSKRLSLHDGRLKRQEERRVNKLVGALLQSLRKEKHEGGSVFPPPHWVGEARPKGARRFNLKSNFPKADYLTDLVSKLGYRGDSAIAALSRAHNPWTRPPADRRQVSCRNADEQDSYGSSDSVGVSEHPYRPDSPSRRTKVGGGLTKAQVENGLRKMRNTMPNIKTALVEIVYRRRSTLQVSNETNIPLEILYVYASRLRGHIHAEGQADSSVEENVS